MLGILFAQSKHYSDKLSLDVKRGIRAKIAQGWPSGPVSVGYLNDRANRIVVRDPERFELVQGIFRLFLQGISPTIIAGIAKDEWGLTTPKHRKVGGTFLCVSSIYRILTNPFYCGFLRLNGELHPGKQPQMVSVEDFSSVQSRLGKRFQPRPHKKEFAFTGLIRCGECHSGVTAEEKTNRYGRKYVYYHCTKKRGLCKQRGIRDNVLEQQISLTLQSVKIPMRFQQWALRCIKRQRQGDASVAVAIDESLRTAYESCQKQLERLLSLRLQELIGDEEYLERKRTITLERETFKEKLDASQQGGKSWLELADHLLQFAAQSENWFKNGSLRQKRVITEIIGSNLLLKDRKLRLQTAKTFQVVPEGLKNSGWWATVQNIRTFCRNHQNIAEFGKTLSQLRELVSGFGL